MMQHRIFIVDDDRDARELYVDAFDRAGHQAVAFAEGRTFLRLARDQVPDCVMLDICMPEKSGIDILCEIDAKSYPAPIVALSGRYDVSTLKAAMRHGAFDYVEKQLGPENVVAMTLALVEEWRALKKPYRTVISESPLCNRLTRREREVLQQIVSAASNKETAKTLGISPRTAEIHRFHIMKKLGAKNAIDLMRILTNIDENDPL